jgi:hypothetical protein
MPASQAAGPDAVTYTAQAKSGLANGEVSLTIGRDALVVQSPAIAIEVPFASINRITIENYAVNLETDQGDFSFQRMGSWCEPFYQALAAAYGQAVLRAMFIKSEPIVSAKCDYRYSEQQGVTDGDGLADGPVHSQGQAHAYVFDDAVVVLPPDTSARRVPLCFVGDLAQAGFELTLTVGAQDSYTFARLGYDTDPFAEAVKAQMTKLGAKTLAAVKGIDPTLTPVQSSQIARMMPMGAAAETTKLAAVAPSFVAALESRIGEGRIEYYRSITELSGLGRMHIGLIDNHVADVKDNTLESGPLAAVPSLAGIDAFSPAPEAAVGEAPLEPAMPQAEPEPYTIWVIAPSPDGRYATVEFFADDTATFVYSTGGDFDRFVDRLNRALEAINFKREVIRLTAQELLEPQNADYYMAAKRTAALKLVLASFVGRVIHSSVDGWRRRLLEIWQSGASD